MITLVGIGAPRSASARQSQSATQKQNLRLQRIARPKQETTPLEQVPGQPDDHGEHAHAVIMPYAGHFKARGSSFCGEQLTFGIFLKPVSETFGQERQILASAVILSFGARQILLVAVPLFGVPRGRSKSDLPMSELTNQHPGARISGWTVSKCPMRYQIRDNRTKLPQLV
jgi:hypothetical protein